MYFGQLSRNNKERRLVLKLELWKNINEIKKIGEELFMLVWLSRHADIEISIGRTFLGDKSSG